MNKYYIAVDCEGVACAVGIPGKGLSEYKNYDYACLEATREANAAAKALFDTGAEEVYVWDAHGAGVNLHYDILDERCKIVLGAGHKGRFVGIDNSFAGVLFIGYHAKENTLNATLSHTFCSSAFQYYKLNGQEVGELEIDAAFAGEYGVPVLFCASDNQCVAQAQQLFVNVETVITKESLSWTSAISKHPVKVCTEIYETVKKAVSNKEKMQPYRLTYPINVEIRYKRMEDAFKAVLIDMNGKSFSQPDSFTRRGDIQGIKDIIL